MNRSHDISPPFGDFNHLNKSPPLPQQKSNTDIPSPFLFPRKEEEEEDEDDELKSKVFSIS